MRSWTDPVDRGPVPRHVAIIMDGNGRWARRRLLPRIEGHRAGTRSVRRSLEIARSLGVEYLTLYTFSLENWERPAAEVNELMRLLKQHLLSEKPTLLKEGIRLRAIGQRERLPAEVRQTLEMLERDTAAGNNLNLVLALSYGSRQEIAGAAAALASEGRRGPTDATDFERHLSTAGLPPVDLLIRTSGECRLSNFMLWQAQGAYLHIIPTLWPSFKKPHFIQAIASYQAALGERPARLGGIGAR